MGGTLIATLFAGGAVVSFRKIDNKRIILQILFAFLAIFCAAFAFVSLVIGIFGLCNTGNDIFLLRTHDLKEPITNESSIVFFDEAGTTYTLLDDRVTIVKDEYNSNSYACIVIKGDYEKAFIEEYNVEYYMNFWTFAVGDGKVFKLYVPDSPG